MSVKFIRQTFYMVPIIPGIGTGSLWGTAVIVEALLGVQPWVHYTVESGGSSLLWGPSEN